MFIVSDELLERLNCSQCKKYLSVKTIKVYPNRGIKCGRCSNSEDAGVVSLFGILAEQALFRCVNRFEGCNLLLSYSDVAEHEKSCVGNKYDCMNCAESFQGSAYEIYIHFKEQHSKQLLVNTSEFVLEMDNDQIKSYLYRSNDLLFYVNARYSKGEEELILNVMYLGTDSDALQVTQLFTLHSLDGKLKYKTKRKSCCSVSGGNPKSFKINISLADFSKNIVLCRFDLNTENVENLVALPENFKKSKRKLVDKKLTELGNIAVKSSANGTSTSNLENKRPNSNAFDSFVFKKSAFVTSETDLQDKKPTVLGSTIIKPSAFGTKRYPVTIFNPPTTSDSQWGIQPPSSTISGGTSGFLFSPPSSVNQVNLLTTTTKIPTFGTSTATTSSNRPFTTDIPVTAPSTLNRFGVCYPSNQPVTTTVSSSVPRATFGFGQSDASIPWNVPVTNSQPPHFTMGPFGPLPDKKK